MKTGVIYKVSDTRFNTWKALNARQDGYFTSGACDITQGQSSKTCTQDAMYKGLKLYLNLLLQHQKHFKE